VGTVANIERRFRVHGFGPSVHWDDAPCSGSIYEDPAVTGVEFSEQEALRLLALLESLDGRP
jgi:hypothetical protein